MKVKYKTYGKSTKNDPEGVLDPTASSEFLDAEVSGTTLYIPSINTYKLNSVEGSGVGQWSRYSNFTTAEYTVLRNTFQTLSNDADSVVANAAKSMISIFTETKNINTATTLRSIALNNANQTLRLFAMILLGLMILKERD